MKNTMTTPHLYIARNPNSRTTPAELRQLLKDNLGLNAKQVTVSRVYPHSDSIVVQIRDGSVNIEDVKRLMKPFHTWAMDSTDYCEGQSVKVVRAVKFVPHREPETPRIIHLCADQDGFNANGQQALVEVDGVRSIRLLSSL